MYMSHSSSSRQSSLRLARRYRLTGSHHRPAKVQKLYIASPSNPNDRDTQPQQARLSCIPIAAGAFLCFAFSCSFCACAAVAPVHRPFVVSDVPLAIFSPLEGISEFAAPDWVSFLHTRFFTKQGENNSLLSCQKLANGNNSLFVL